MREMTIVNQKLMLAGLFLSRFSDEGLRALGFSTWREAYNSLALSVGGKPSSLKLYRQEFDPYFPNGRVGWVHRGIRQTRKELIDRYSSLEFAEFVQMVKAQFASEYDMDASIGKVTVAAGIADEDTAFARRMMTGYAAENFFEEHYREFPDFANCLLSRTTAFGCGFDFKLTPPKDDFLAVEVKGLRAKSGQIQLTEKEYKMAEYLSKRFYLYVVTDFAHTPRPCIIGNPLNSGIAFESRSVESRNKMWVAKIAA